jgi:L-amino acid N-acyltransferase YncA
MKINFGKIRENSLKPALKLFNYYIVHSTAVWIVKKINMKQFREIIPVKNKKYKSYVITGGREFCGFCCFKQYNKRQGYDRTAELSVYLKPEFTGKGIGRQAISFLEKQAKKTGIKVLVGSISGDNKSSIKLLKKSGYVKCGHFKKIGEKFGKVLDVVYYQKIITN